MLNVGRAVARRIAGQDDGAEMVKKIPGENRGSTLCRGPPVGESQVVGNASVGVWPGAVQSAGHRGIFQPDLQPARQEYAREGAFPVRVAVGQTFKSDSKNLKINRYLSHLLDWSGMISPGLRHLVAGCCTQWFFLCWVE